MDQKTRQEYILNKIKAQETITTQQLVDEYKVSFMTIRRDLQALQEAGYIQLIHGGAVWNDAASHEHAISYKKQLFTKEKQAIADHCLSLVKKNEVVFIETGTTTLAVAQALTTQSQLTIFSNSLSAVNVLAKFDTLSLFSVPGHYRELSDGFLGALTTQFIQQFTYDLVFVGTEGIDLTHGISVPDMEDALTKRSVIEHAKKVVLVADHSKFGQAFPYRVCDFDQIACIVTDQQLDESICQQFLAAGVSVIRAASK